MYHFLAHIDPNVEKRLIDESKIARQNQLEKLESLEKSNENANQPDGLPAEEFDESDDDSVRVSQIWSEFDEDVFRPWI